MQIILRKVATHSNENTPKNCIRDLLKSPSIDLDILFNHHLTVVYDHVIPILNIGHFYADSSLQKDSKFFSYVFKFFSRAYNLMDNKTLTMHLTLFLKGIIDHITYDQALPAFLLVFKHLETPIAFFTKSQVNILVAFFNKVYRNVHMRKRWQIIDAIVECLEKFLLPEVGFKELLTIVLTIPDEAYQWRFVQD